MEGSISPVRWLLAMAPIGVVLLLMIRFRWGGSRAGPAGWLVALAVSILFFGAGMDVVAYSQMRAVMLSLFVLYLVWMALILYNVAHETGVIATIGQGIVRLTGDPVMQLLILAWVFSSFLQGVSGYGVPTAIVAPLLIGLGFTPVTSVVAVAVGHSWSVTFGSIAASFSALVAASGMSVESLAPSAAGLLGAGCFACGAAVAHAYGGRRAVVHGWPAILLLGAVMAGTQYALATAGLWSIAGFGAGIAGLAASALLVRAPRYRQAATSEIVSLPGVPECCRPMGMGHALMSYGLLVAIVTGAEVVQPLHALLNAVKLQLTMPPTVTALGWSMPATHSQAVSVFGHPGALLLYTSLIVYFLYCRSGHCNRDIGRRVIRNTAHHATNASIGIVSMVGFALLMEQSGMTAVIATGIGRAFQPVYPFLAPFIGLLGSFMTGSNTNSNVVFTGLQMQASQLLGLPAALILAAQTTGGALGTMLAPARIIVGCSTAGLVGQEGLVLKRTVAYGLAIAGMVGVITWLGSR